MGFLSSFFPLPGMPAQGAVLENKKGDSQNGYPLRNGHKQAQYPYIGYCACYKD